MSNRVKHMEIWVFDHASLDFGFKIIDEDGFDGPLNYLMITNNTGVEVLISFDGIRGHEYVRKDDNVSIMTPLCSRGSNKRCLFRNKTKVYASLVANQPKGGELVVQGFYQE